MGSAPLCALGKAPTGHTPLKTVPGGPALEAYFHSLGPTFLLTTYQKVGEEESKCLLRGSGGLFEAGSLLTAALPLWVWEQRCAAETELPSRACSSGEERLTALRWATPKELLPCKPAAAPGGK